MKQINVKKTLLPNIPYVFIALFATKLGQAARLAPGADFSQKALHIMEGFAAAFQSALPSFHPIDLCVGVAAALLIRLAVYVKGKNARKFRKNIEYGSARWGNAEDIKPYVDPTFANNVILTQTERLTMNSRPKDPKTARNKNVLVVGGSGSGKTRFFIKPNLMQLHSSYVVTDPKGSIVVECGKLLQRNQYKIKILNTINFKKSHHYNPFAYLHSEKDILKLVTTLIANTQGDGKSGDDFWRKAETLLYTALIGYIYYEAPVEEQNFATLIEMINTMEVREDDEDFKNPVDLMFEELAKREPHHFAVRQYAKYRLAGCRSLKSSFISSTSSSAKRSAMLFSLSFPIFSLPFFFIQLSFSPSFSSPDALSSASSSLVLSRKSCSSLKYDKSFCSSLPLSSSRVLAAARSGETYFVVMRLLTSFISSPTLAYSSTFSLTL